MKLNKVIAIPAIALAAGISLSACGSTTTLPVITHTVTAPAAAPKPTTPAPKATGASSQWVACEDWERASDDGISSPMGLSVQGLEAAISASTDPVLTGYLRADLSDQNAGNASAVTSDINSIYAYCNPATPAPAPTTAPTAAATPTWSTNCVVLSDNQFRLYATNNTGQGQTTPGWTVLVYDNGVQVGSVDNSGAGVLPSNYASPGQTVSSKLWTLNSQYFTSCEATS
jgi:hypothetical protein